MGFFRDHGPPGAVFLILGWIEKSGNPEDRNFYLRDWDSLCSEISTFMGFLRDKKPTPSCVKGYRMFRHISRNKLNVTWEVDSKSD